jgi:RHH-type transcriptional regulator, rel operon repressor / antitoxin RelB
MGKTMISARIPDEMDRDLDKLVASTKRSKSFLVEEALENYIESKLWLTEKINKAVEDADKDGRFVSEDDMSAWLKTWGTPEAKILPKLRNRDGA